MSYLKLNGIDFAFLRPHRHLVRNGSILPLYHLKHRLLQLHNTTLICHSLQIASLSYPKLGRIDFAFLKQITPSSPMADFVLAPPQTLVVATLLYCSHGLLIAICISQTI
jgi:hypothetical protein